MAPICLPGAMSPREIKMMDTIVQKDVHLHKGENLYRLGAPVTAIHAVRHGMVKSHVSTEDGRSQILSFHLQGDVVDLSSLLASRHTCYVSALEDSKLCVIPLKELQIVLQEIPSLWRQLLIAMKKASEHDRGMLTALGLMSAEERVVAFLLNLSSRLSARGVESSEFSLRMSREEIGSYLGLKLETVSRAFSRLADAGIIDVSYRRVSLANIRALHAIYDRCNSGMGTETNTDRGTSSLNVGRRLIWRSTAVFVHRSSDTTI